MILNSTSTQSPQFNQLVFIDENVDNYQFLADNLVNGAEAIILRRDDDAIATISAALENYASIYGTVDSIHIVSHGSPGQLQLGSTLVNSDNLHQYASQLQQWRSLLTENADILLYGCDVAAGEKGQSLIDRLHQLTGADIAASTDLTGSRALRGNWDLEATVGDIQTASVLSSQAQATYNRVLATLTVTNTANSGAGSLRNAIAAAQSGDTIQFASSLANKTITLSSAQLTIDKSLTIDASAAANLTISGNNAFRVFEISPNADAVTLRNLKIANGRASGNTEAGAGGGIKTASNTVLTVENCQINNNFAQYGGGGIFTGFRGKTTVINSQFNGNDGTAGNQERGGGAIATKSEGSLTVTGSTFNNNKGINGGAINSLLGTLTVDNSTFLNNDTTPGQNNSSLSGYGGAIYTDGASALTNDSVGGIITIRNSRFEGNKGAGEGGAMFLYTYDPDKIEIEGCTIINNQVITKSSNNASFGGGIRIGNAEFTISKTTFANNIAESQGGGLWLGETSSGTIVNSTFSGNKAQNASNQGLGGAITFNNRSNSIKITNATFANNYAGSFGGGFWGGGSNVTLINTIVAKNSAGNAFNKNLQTGTQFSDGGGNIQFPAKNASDATDVNVTANVTISDPLLGPLQDNGGGLLTQALLPGSPAIDSGTNTGAPSTDQLGVTRPIDGNNNGSAVVDSGAIEFSLGQPEIEVLDNATNIADGTTTAINFGTATVGSPISKIFTLKNTGTAQLTLSNLLLPTGFSLVGTLPASVAAGKQITLTVNLNPTTAGTFKGELSLKTNDSNENPFNFAISGIVNPPTSTTTNPYCRCDQFPTPNISIGTPIANTVTATRNGTSTQDTLRGTVNNEALIGANGNDIIVGLQGNDNLDGGDGNDALYGNTGNDYIVGGAGNNTLFGGRDTDVLIGGTQLDILSGDIGNDTLNGGDGADQLYGNQGDDLIDGSGGDDRIYGGQENDALTGGLGDDIMAGEIGNDTLTGADGNDKLDGNVGTDFLDGGAGIDTLNGGEENDILKGAAGNDSIVGDLGNDTICGDDDNDLLYGNDDSDLLDGCAGSDTLFGGNQNDIVVGNSGTDNINGDAGNDILYGNISADTLNGADGNDSIFGGKDNDILTGGIGDDSLLGDLGSDTITGGEGRDRFILSATSGSDVITDFTDGIDLLGLSGGLTFAQLAISKGSSAAEIRVSSTGALLASLTGVNATLIAAADFVTV